MMNASEVQVLNPTAVTGCIISHLVLNGCRRVGASSDDLFEEASDLAADHIELMTAREGNMVEDIDSTSSFDFGLRLGIEMATAVMANPFGDSTSKAIESALCEVRRDLESRRARAEREGGHYHIDDGCNYCKAESRGAA